MFIELLAFMEIQATVKKFLELTTLYQHTTSLHDKVDKSLETCMSENKIYIKKDRRIQLMQRWVRLFGGL